MNPALCKYDAPYPVPRTLDQVPEHTHLQVEHQLMVTKADIADVYIFDGTEGVIFPVAPDESAWPRICSA